MKLGFFTAAFPGKSLEEVAAWAAEKIDDLIKRGFLLSRDVLRPYIK